MRISRDLAIAVCREKCTRSLYEFVKRAWHVVESSPFSDGWHLAELCLHLEALYRLDIRDLGVAMPPGTTKSLVCSVFFPAWCWTQDPGFRVMSSSVDITLALRDARRSRELVESEWYQVRWGDTVQLVTKGSRKSGRDRSESGSQYWTTADGLRFTTSVESKAVGWHVHLRIVDDPIKPADATPTRLRACQDWWTGTMASRRADHKRFRSLIVQQRVAKHDLIGYAIDAGYAVLCLPMEYDPRRHCKTPVGGDRRTQPGELLVPDRIGPAEIAEMKSPKGLGRHYRAQGQQDPTSDDIVIFAESDLGRFYRKLPPGGYHAWSWDMRFKSERDSGSYVAGQNWYRLGPDAYLVGERRGRWGFTRSRDEVRAGAKAQPGPVLIEDKANGPAVQDSLRLEVPGIVMVGTGASSKVERANAIAPFVASNVYLPHPSIAPWILDWISEVHAFPAEPNDRADAMATFLKWSYLERGSSYGAALGALGKKR